MVYFDIPLTNVMLVSPEGHITVFLVDEPDQSFAIPSTLRGQTESYSSPVQSEQVMHYNKKMVTSDGEGSIVCIRCHCVIPGSSLSLAQ